MKEGRVSADILGPLRFILLEETGASWNKTSWGALNRIHTHTHTQVPHPKTPSCRGEHHSAQCNTQRTRGGWEGRGISHTEMKNREKEGDCGPEFQAHLQGLVNISSVDCRHVVVRLVQRLRSLIHLQKHRNRLTNTTLHWNSRCDETTPPQQRHLTETWASGHRALFSPLWVCAV